MPLLGRSHGRWHRGWLGAAACLLWVALGGTARAQDNPVDTTFFSAEELATRLLHNVVWIAASDIGEHGYGLVVGGNAQTLWVVTARHVVVRTALLGSQVADQPSRQIQMRLCSAPATEILRAKPWPGWDGSADDIALLTVPRPTGYQPVTRALAPNVAVGDTTWLLGSNEECAVVPAPGQVRALADAADNRPAHLRHKLRIDFAGVLGGSSGAPVINGSGVLGLMQSAEDLTTLVHAIQDLQRRISALPGVVWSLEDARNIAPTDPKAAQIDLAETLNGYLLALRNVHGLLLGRQVQRPTLDAYMQRYNTFVRRFLRVRNAYDGSLAVLWPAPVLPAWSALRQALWAVHLTFWRINPQMGEIYAKQLSTDDVRAQMAALEPGLVQLDADIQSFLQSLTKEK